VPPAKPPPRAGNPENLQAAASRAEEDLDRFFTHAGILLAVAGFDGRFRRLNPAWTHLLGHDLTELHGQSYLGLVHADDRDVARQSMQQLLEGQSAVMETRYRCRNGSYQWVLWNTAPFPDRQEFYITGQIITERKLAEEGMRVSEERYRQMFENDITGDFISTPEGKLLTCNAAFARIFGFDSVEEALTVDTRELYPDPAVRAELLTELAAKKALSHRELELRRRDGKPVHVIENIIASCDSQGRITQINGYLFDNTERKNLEEQLRQAQKMEAIGRLAGGISHDFNNLLTVITGYSEVVLGQIGDKHALAGPIAEIRQAAGRAASLTRQLLAFSRKQVLTPRPTDLNAIVIEMKRLLQRLIGEDIKLEIALGKDLRQVRVDPGQIEQVIMNLVVNSRDAMPRGGRLLIETANVELDLSGVHGRLEMKPGSYVLLAVTDTGLGMDAATVARVFEPFFTTKGSGEGTGLGLAMVYGIIKQSDGHIFCYSEPDRGTVFKIYLPSMGPSSECTVAAPNTHALRGGTECILLVEDDEAVRNLARVVLAGQGYQVLEAASGQAALAVCQDHPGTVDLLLTDVIMPQVTGPELYERLRTRRPKLAVLYMSGYTNDAITRHGPLEEGTNFVQKPFTPSGLAKKIREVLDGTMPKRPEQPQSWSGSAPSGSPPL
jgi:two-component system, cell cycle sensor histidine kinase and response regulator CckA